MNAIAAIIADDAALLEELCNTPGTDLNFRRPGDNQTALLVCVTSGSTNCLDILLSQVIEYSL